jgi:hypothetical protein
MFLVGINLFAKPVDIFTARAVAGNFAGVSADKLDVLADAKHISPLQDGGAAYYIFNSDNGFVIVAGDDAVIPILAYSTEGNISLTDVPPNAKDWLNYYEQQIRYVIANNIPATEQIQQEWNDYIKGKKQGDALQAQSVPLIQTKWDQGGYYSSFTPRKYYTGCTAVAMAQIMKYWNYPVVGIGNHSYNWRINKKDSLISAVFSDKRYKWDEMPNTANSNQYEEIATLMYHCGVSVDMHYGADGSSAAVIKDDNGSSYACSENALVKYFGYKNSLIGYKRDQFSDIDWNAMLKKEIDAGRPILYVGYGQEGGHAFICDAYATINSTLKYHFNWGWSGHYDGYFTLNMLNPGTGQAGAGSGTFNWWQQALIGIESPTGKGGFINDSLTYVNSPYQLTLTMSVTPSTDLLNYTDNPYTITANVKNTGNINFQGDFCAAVFDYNNRLVDYVEILPTYALNAGDTYSNDLVFKMNNTLKLLPGDYFVSVYYRPTGGDWIRIAQDKYSNWCLLSVRNMSDLDIELKSDLNFYPSTTLEKDRTASVYVNVVNVGKSVFKGEYQVGLYNFDGELLQEIGKYKEDLGLPVGSSYSSNLEFTTPSISVDTGKYYVALMYKTSTSDWKFVGSMSYQNPVTVAVSIPSLAPDSYEPNNTVDEASLLLVNIGNTKTTVVTTGSNLHNAADDDYYYISLRSVDTTLDSVYLSANYTVTARVSDSKNWVSGKKYTTDVEFTVSDDKVNWSNAYDDEMPDTMYFENGGNMYFYVKPYAFGEFGTYQLEITINRTLIPRDTIDNIYDADLSEAISVYPMPAKEVLNLDFADLEGVSAVEMYDIAGRQAYRCEVNSNERYLQIPLKSLSEKFYIVYIYTKTGIASKKVVLE